MRRRSTLLLAALLVAGCQIEPTPSEYIDSVAVADQDIGNAEEEITARLRLTAPALERRNLNGVLAALTPSSNLEGWGPISDEPIQDANTLSFALAALTAGRQVGIDELVVRMSPRNTESWFIIRYRVVGEEEEYNVRFSGVFLSQQGEWRLVQAHISRATEPDPPPEG